jgi:hypothetical protein
MLHSLGWQLATEVSDNLLVPFSMVEQFKYLPTSPSVPEEQKPQLHGDRNREVSHSSSCHTLRHKFSLANNLTNRPKARRGNEKGKQQIA